MLSGVFLPLRYIIKTLTIFYLEEDVGPQLLESWLKVQEPQTRES